VAKQTLYGGQAVLEGVMMRGPAGWAVACRDPEGRVVSRSFPDPPARARRRWLRLPLLRGVVALGESLALGMRALSISARVAEGEDLDEAPDRLGRAQMAFTFALALGFVVLVFKVTPALLADQLPLPAWLFVLVEGLIRITLFVGYLALLSRLQRLRRVFQYHGAEHKTINAFEDGAKLEPSQVRSYSLIHPRCGTAFLLWVMVVAVFVFALFGRPAWYWLVASRILLLPLIAGLAFEVIRFGAAHQESRLVRALLAPGLWLQRLTTAEPDSSQLEVACAAFLAARALESDTLPAAAPVEAEATVLVAA
jgi:uncharacterized protein YqhQ